MSRWQLWMVFLFLPPGLLSEESKHSSEAGQTRRLQETRDGLVNQTETLQESDSDGMRVTRNSSPPSDGGRTAVTTTPFRVFVTESSTKYQARKLAEPTIAVLSVNGTCNVSANCMISGGGGGDVSYVWSHSGTKVVLSRDQTLRITQEPPDGSFDFTCTVRNEESETSSTISLKEHCQDPSSPRQGASASVYTKYLVPFLVVLVLLVALFFMYRRKRGSGARSRTVSINESLDSEDEDRPKVAQAFPRQAFTPIPEETLQMTQALASSEDEEIPDSQDPHSSQT